MRILSPEGLQAELTGLKMLLFWGLYVSCRVGYGFLRKILGSELVFVGVFGFVFGVVCAVKRFFYCDRSSFVLVGLRFTLCCNGVLAKFFRMVTFYIIQLKNPIDICQK